MLAELALTGLVAFFPQQLNCNVWTGRLSFSFTTVMVSVAEVISWLERLILFLPSCHQFSLSSLWQNCNFHFHSEVCFNLLPHAIHLNPLFPKQEIIKNSCEFWPQPMFFFFFPATFMPYISSKGSKWQQEQMGGSRGKKHFTVEEKIGNWWSQKLLRTEIHQIHHLFAVRGVH